MSYVSTMTEFRKVKADLFEKYGDGILMGDDTTRAKILKDLIPAARFAKMPAERLLTALATQYVEHVQPTTRGASLGEERSDRPDTLRSVP